MIQKGNACTPVIILPGQQQEQNAASYKPQIGQQADCDRHCTMRPFLHTGGEGKNVKSSLCPRDEDMKGEHR
jgi:hypothetical protein